MVTPPETTKIAGQIEQLLLRENRLGALREAQKAEPGLTRVNFYYRVRDWRSTANRVVGKGSAA